MNFTGKILMLLLFFSCTSDRSNKDLREDGGLKEVVFLEISEINQADSSKLIETWKVFLQNFSSIKNRSLQEVECWSSEDYLKGEYSTEPISVDSCLFRYLLPLQRSKVWLLINTHDFNVDFRKYENESVGRYCISFPGDRDYQTRSYVFMHYFYFKKVEEVFLFEGYVYT
jgi:hypothetical protein